VFYFDIHLINQKDTRPYINEILYDPAGNPDRGEFIEVAVNKKDNISYSIVLYNGSNRQARTVTPNSITTFDGDVKYIVFDYANNQLQNGV
jgi:hypothetical protein